ncbi:MAG TPA: hypothetical protein IAB57_03455 [Candidatus Fimivivens faecavium]|nr:hypothetical protein [Candidatus Fimivivens faecavium]
MSPSWNQPAYTSADMLTMQQDALRRVREMQARARASVSASNAARAAQAAKAAQETQDGAAQQPEPSAETQRQAQNAGVNPPGQHGQNRPRQMQGQNPQQHGGQTFSGPMGQRMGPGFSQNGMPAHPQQRRLSPGMSGRNQSQGAQRPGGPPLAPGAGANRPAPQRMRVQNPLQSLSSMFGMQNRRQRADGFKPEPKPGDAMKSISTIIKGLGDKGLGSTASSLGDSLTEAISSVSEPVAKLLDAFDIDGEKLIILMIMFIIFNERGDKTLLLALGYLLL